VGIPMDPTEAIAVMSARFGSMFTSLTKVLVALCVHPAG
jgi:hypothetical protein